MSAQDDAKNSERVYDSPSKKYRLSIDLGISLGLGPRTKKFKK